MGELLNQFPQVQAIISQIGEILIALVALATALDKFLPLKVREWMQRRMDWVNKLLWWLPTIGISPMTDVMRRGVALQKKDARNLEADVLSLKLQLKSARTNAEYLKEQMQQTNESNKKLAHLAYEKVTKKKKTTKKKTAKKKVVKKKGR